MLKRTVCYLATTALLINFGSVASAQEVSESLSLTHQEIALVEAELEGTGATLEDFLNYLEEDEAYQISDGQIAEIEEPPAPESTHGTQPRGMSTIEYRDESAAALYFRDGFSSFQRSLRTCTANYIGGKFWMTAHHCINGRTNEIGYLRQSDGEFAGIEAIYFPDAKYDFALIKVGSGINASPLALPTANPAIGAKLTHVGWSGNGTSTNPFSSKTDLTVVGFEAYVDIQVGDNKIHRYYDVIRLRASGPNTCAGDSGGSAFSQDRVTYAVLTGGPRMNPSTYSCYGDKSFTNVVPHLSWVKDTKSVKSGTSLVERIRAFRGGMTANFSKANAPVSPTIVGFSSSSI